ncbi:hypothetical protein ASPBRDRAFT_427177 [Aspergillus brasiliensis CBS 101740]|uniref:Uncharacterized protein n=1 Tax=Aspergillus brasiliensis (strain CBS 101740 / IMI 381727 / IBT 21946) TaxID=767769 RepID=A0A1L9U431_ASPBC|nr:hypothetical protein ASPBRDRAFT_427177 [Aspergillus brasiliensis CBS 101740]
MCYRVHEGAGLSARAFALGSVAHSPRACPAETVFAGWGLKLDVRKVREGPHREGRLLVNTTALVPQYTYTSSTGVPIGYSFTSGEVSWTYFLTPWAGKACLPTRIDLFRCGLVQLSLPTRLPKQNNNRCPSLLTGRSPEYPRISTGLSGTTPSPNPLVPGEVGHFNLPTPTPSRDETRQKPQRRNIYSVSTATRVVECQ